MEGSVSAGPAAAQGDGQGQPGDGEQNGNGQQPTDLSQLLDGLTGLQTSQEEMRNFLQQEPWAQQQDAAAYEQQLEPAPQANLDLFDPASPQYDPQQAAQHLTDLIDQQASARAEAIVAPLGAQVEDMRRSREADALAGEFPELADSQKASELLRTTEEVAVAHGHPELVAEPWFWKQTHEAMRAREIAREEGHAEPGPNAATLEGANGARPAAASGSQLTADAIVNAKRGRSVLPFG